MAMVFSAFAASLYVVAVVFFRWQKLAQLYYSVWFAVVALACGIVHKHSASSKNLEYLNVKPHLQNTIIVPEMSMARPSTQLKSSLSSQSHTQSSMVDLVLVPPIDKVHSSAMRSLQSIQKYEEILFVRITYVMFFVFVCLISLYSIC
ncbi:unnamed protein product [Fraxinus pennsylvanica]|uniref:Uncharacterized protein n=1 Tax=Fraxinus pennsylvanica TaxID=56036 RepID=A0AAD2DSA4_9LAMI|nr:unnamed protein product [Fraxinus pennsylvanica]